MSLLQSFDRNVALALRNEVGKSRLHDELQPLVPESFQAKELTWVTFLLWQKCASLKSHDFRDPEDLDIVLNSDKRRSGPAWKKQIKKWDSSSRVSFAP